MIILQNGSNQIQNANLVVNPSIVTDGLIFYMDAANNNSYSGATNTTGTTYYSVVGAYSGSLVGTTVFQTTPNNFKTNCSTITDIGYLTVSPAITFNDGSEYTFETYIKLRENVVSASANSLAGRGNVYPWYYVQPLLSGATFRGVYRELSGGTTYFFTILSTPNIITSWVNLTLVVKSTREVQLYVNGSYISSVNPLSTYFLVSRIAGGYQNVPNYNGLQGNMSMFKIYNRALTSTEVLQNYNATKSRYQ